MMYSINSQLTDTRFIANLIKISEELYKKFQKPVLLFDGDTNLRGYINHETGKNFVELPNLVRISNKGIADLQE